MCVKEGAEGWDVAVVNVMELKSRAFCARVLMVALSQKFNAVEDCLKGIAQVVDDYNIIASLQEFEGGMRADEAETTGDEDILAIEGEIFEAGIKGFEED